MSEKQYIEFNINSMVRVKLKESGRKTLAERHERLIAYYGYRGPECFPPPIGEWTELQMWLAMNLFGEHIMRGMETPFEATIQIEATK